jgi:hypothetical protein
MCNWNSNGSVLLWVLSHTGMYCFIPGGTVHIICYWFAWVLFIPVILSVGFGTVLRTVLCERGMFIYEDLREAEGSPTLVV